MSGSTEKALVVAKRPDSSGQEGSVIYLMANHFLVKFDPSQKIYHSNVDISPHPSNCLYTITTNEYITARSGHSHILEDPSPSIGIEIRRFQEQIMSYKARLRKTRKEMRKRTLTRQTQVKRRRFYSHCMITKNLRFSWS